MSQQVSMKSAPNPSLGPSQGPTPACSSELKTASDPCTDPDHASAPDPKPSTAAKAAPGSQPGRKPLLKRLALIALVLAAIAVPVRIAWVNAHAVVVPTEYYDLGEWVDLTGCYFDDARSENMEGYRIRAVQAEAISFGEFKERFDTEDLDPGTAFHNDEEKAIVLAEFEVENTADEEGGLVLFRYNLVPERRNVAYRFDTNLWDCINPLTRNMPSAIGVAPYTTADLALPFSYTSDPSYLEAFDREYRMPVGDDDLFEMVLCNAPVRKVLRIPLSEG